jgi:hypothetical protein
MAELLQLPTPESMKHFFIMGKYQIGIGQLISKGLFGILNSTRK